MRLLQYRDNSFLGLGENCSSTGLEGGSLGTRLIREVPGYVNTWIVGGNLILWCAKGVFPLSISGDLLIIMCD